MLANGIKLGYKTDESATTYTDLIGLKEVPEMGNEPEKVEEFPDGTKFSWAAQVSVKLSSGAVNGVMEFTLKMALQSDIVVTDPS